MRIVHYMPGSHPVSKRCTVCQRVCGTHRVRSHDHVRFVRFLEHAIPTGGTDKLLFVYAIKRETVRTHGKRTMGTVAEHEQSTVVTEATMLIYSSIRIEIEMDIKDSLTTSCVP